MRASAEVPAVEVTREAQYRAGSVATDSGLGELVLQSQSVMFDALSLVVASFGSGSVDSAPS